jgi:quercetin dioxygenase-like cupin family protein
MQLHNWDQLTEERLNASVTRQVIHGSNITVAKLRTRKGALVPTHSHPNEQITTLEQGAMLFVTPTEKIIVRAGESLCIPPNVPHSVESLEDSIAVDVFSPVREDWVRGDDAYLRG